MSGAQILNESDIFASKESVSIFSTEERRELSRMNRRKTSVEREPTQKEEEVQIREYVEEYKREVEKKFLTSKANANFKLKRLNRNTISKKRVSRDKELKTEENKYERISSRKTNKENRWTKPKEAFEPSFEMIGDSEIITQARSSLEAQKRRSQSRARKSGKGHGTENNVETKPVLKKTKLKMKREILRRLRNSKFEKSEQSVSTESAKEKPARKNLFIIEKNLGEYDPLASVREMNFVDLRAEKVKSDLLFLRKKYFAKRKKRRKMKKASGEDKENSQSDKAGLVNLETWRLTKIVYLLSKLDKRHLQQQLGNPESCLHRELIDAVLRLVGVNLDFARVFRQGVMNESILQKFRPSIVERSHRLEHMEKRLQKRVFRTRDKNEEIVLSFKDSMGRSTKYKDLSPEHLMLIRSKEVLMSPENLSLEKSRPSSMKIHKTTSQNCYKSENQKKVKATKPQNSSLTRKHRVIKPASFVHPNFMTMSGVNNTNLLHKTRPPKKGKSVKTRRMKASAPGKKHSDMWEDFLVKNVKTKIKKLNILKRDKGNNFSISINNNNYNNNINLINPGGIKNLKRNKHPPKSPKLGHTYQNSKKTGNMFKYKAGRSSNSQNFKKIRASKGLRPKKENLPRKMHSLKVKRNPGRSAKTSQFKTQKPSGKTKIRLDLVNKKSLLNTSSRVKSSRIISKKLQKPKPVSSVLQKITKKANLKNLALNLPLHPKIPKILNFHKPISKTDKSKYLLASGYLSKNMNISQIKSERQKAYLNAESLHCKHTKKVRSQCVNTSRKMKDSRTWLASDDKVSSHSKSLLRIKEKLKKKADYYKLNNFLKKIKNRNHPTKRKEPHTFRPQHPKLHLGEHQMGPEIEGGRLGGLTQKGVIRKRPGARNEDVQTRNQSTMSQMSQNTRPEFQAQFFSNKPGVSDPSQLGEFDPSKDAFKTSSKGNYGISSNVGVSGDSKNFTNSISFKNFQGSEKTSSSLCKMSLGKVHKFKSGNENVNWKDVNEFVVQRPAISKEAIVAGLEKSHRRIGFTQEELNSLLQMKFLKKQNKTLK